MAKVKDEHYEEFKKEMDKLMNAGLEDVLDDIVGKSGKAVVISKDSFQRLCDTIVYANIEELDIGEIYVLGRFIATLKQAMFDIDEKTEMEEN